MEIKATLEKPFNTKQKSDFIVEQNHNSGYEIKETSTALEAWGYTPEEIKEREEEQFNKDFFNTSLGYIRRNVTMKDGETKSFLTDSLPLLQVGIPVLTYTEDLEQTKVFVTEQFINECKQQLLIDFYGNLDEN